MTSYRLHFPSSSGKQQKLKYQQTFFTLKRNLFPPFSSKKFHHTHIQSSWVLIKEHKGFHSPSRLSHKKTNQWGANGGGAGVRHFECAFVTLEAQHNTHTMHSSISVPYSVFFSTFPPNYMYLIWSRNIAILHLKENQDKFMAIIFWGGNKISGKVQQSWKTFYYWFLVSFFVLCLPECWSVFLCVWVWSVWSNSNAELFCSFFFSRGESLTLFPRRSLTKHLSG